MSEIYNIGYNKNNKIEKLFIFIGDNEVVEEKFEDDIKRIYINQLIHLDDTIDTIHKKMITAWNSLEEHKDNLISMYEIYTYFKQTEKLTTDYVYKKLSTNGTHEIKNEIIQSFLINIDTEYDVIENDNKEFYEYNDILDIHLEKQELYDVAIQLGQRNVIDIPTVPFSATSKSIVKNPKVSITSRNQLLLNNLSSSGIKNNIIYFCLADDVLDYSINNKIDQYDMIKLYYPSLYDKDIKSKNTLGIKHATLVEETKKRIEERIWKENNNNVDFFYNVYNKRESEIKYSKKGINEIYLTIHQSSSFNLPLDVVFKLIHADITVPLIKFNPSLRKEKVYRLYTDKIAKNGKRIPYLKQSRINKIMKEIGMKPCVALYIEYNQQNVVCEFENNGDIGIRIQFVEEIAEEKVDDFIYESTKPYINTVINYLSKSGYMMDGFTSIYNPNVEINKMKYSVTYPLKNNINIQNIQNCLSSIFAISGKEVDKDTIIMRLKRVSNFNESDSQEAYIMDMLKQNVSNVKIVNGLMDNYKLTNIQARTKIKESNELISMKEQNMGVLMKNVAIKNPGFLTYIEKNQISVTGINHIHYLKTIPIYLDSLLRITQFPETITIENNCIKKKEQKPLALELVEEKKKNKVADAVAVDVVPADDVVHADEVVPADEVVHADDDENKKEQKPLALELALVEEKKKNKVADDVVVPVDDVVPADDDENNKNYDSIMDLMLEGGAGSNPENEYKLSHPSYFFERLQSREPTLFRSKKEGNFPSYSTSCQWNRRRQPVILTDDEKKKIDEEHKGSYDTSLSYKSSKDGETFHYICPRYWSFKDGVSITEEEAKLEKYGKIIPRNAKKIDKNENVFEFATDKYDYIKQYPGFMKKKTPDNQLVPCCFNKSLTNQQKQRIKEAAEIFDDNEKEDDDDQDNDQSHDDDDEKDDAKKKKKNEKKKKKENKKLLSEKSKYILGSEKSPLQQGRYGYLPISIQKFLHTDNQKCQISPSTSTSIKKNHPCILRYGVENNSTQSFLSCIGDIIYSDDKSGKVKSLSIKDMKKQLLEAITIDVFISAQNGNLIDIFSTEEKDESNAAIKESVLLKNMNEGKQLLLKNKIIRSYKNFKNFLKDDEVVIDYKYLWDILSTPNPLLFKKGINIIILQLNSDDVTDNVEMICHSKYVQFDTTKRIAIILKNGNVYEPIYIYEDKDNTKSTVSKLFDLKNWRMPPNLKASLDNIFYTLKQCNPLPSIIDFEKNIKLSFLLAILTFKKIPVQKQVINYNARVIGVIVAYDDNKTYFLPCYPSGILMDIEYIWMDDLFKKDEGYLNTYKDTISFLKNIYKKTSVQIKCEPKIKIVEDNAIVGIVTNANQFVPVQPIPFDSAIDDGIPVKHNINYMSADANIISDKVDNERVIFVKKINLENEFYNAFRNTIHVVLGEFKNRKKREDIERIIYSPTKLYNSKMREVETSIHELTKDLFVFEDYSDEILMKINDITNCYNNNNVSCKKTISCNYNDEKKVCSLHIPQKNLINKRDNKQMYYGRITDEIIRYNRIQSFMLQPKSFIAFSEIPYSLNNNEIILLQSLIAEDENNYFDDIVPETTNNYAKYNTHETAQPRNSIQYSNRFQFETRMVEDQLGCEVEKDSDIHRKWMNEFKNCKEFTYQNSDSKCSFEFVIDMIEHIHPNKKVNINEIKTILLDEYIKKYKKYKDTILEILSVQGKQNITKQIKLGQLTFEYMIMSENYYISNLDVWVLAEHFKLPIVFLSNTRAMLKENNKNLLCLYGDGDDNFMFIKTPNLAIKNINTNHDVIPQYKWIVKDDDIKSFKVDSLIKQIKTNHMTLKDYLITQEKEVKKIKKVKDNDEDEGERSEDEGERSEDEKKIKVKAVAAKKIKKVKVIDDEDIYE